MVSNIFKKKIAELKFIDYFSEKNKGNFCKLDWYNFEEQNISDTLETVNL